ncbi:hypothetical protein EST54_08090 [Streptomyces sioyaensis]|uniref:Uncharacterized protein n=1 Tax=Streptomyces sioyaensis TaxID=67364 RepID=A0A4Q1R635_9ACTN|nr:hypothetical protein EST54_08090 [Streptomyces sioyaensis]
MSTVVGAVIGVLATLAADLSRAKRTRQDSEHNARRQLYADYLAALASTRNHLRLAARSAHTPPEERARKAIEAFKEGNAYELRYQVALISPRSVIEASTAAFRALRDLRDLIEEGALHTEPSYLDLRDCWEERFAELRTVMRNNLNSSPPR